jgi:Fic family protein
MEPMRLSDGSGHRPALADLALELATASEGFRRSLPEGIVEALAGLVREMNCYYSNLIEGHDTHPVDIERALKADYSTDPEQRNLQLEARAHVAVQAWIDGGGLRGRAMTVAAIRECHERFGNLLPEELLSVKDPDTGEEEVVVPGEFRKRDVKAAQHVPVSPGAVPRFLARFEVAYGGLGKSESVLATAAGCVGEVFSGRGSYSRVARATGIVRTLLLDS